MQTAAADPPVDATTRLWDRAADALIGAAQAQGVLLRDVIWLLPFAALLPLARAAFARRGVWPPRIETPATLAEQCPPPLPEPALCADAVIDSLRVQQLLASSAALSQWRARDPAAFAQAASAVLHTAQAWSAALTRLAPPLRSAWLAQVRAGLQPAADRHAPGQRERQLALLAFEWVAACGSGPLDALHTLQPSAWAITCAGGAPAAWDASALGEGAAPIWTLDMDAWALAQPSTPAFYSAADAEQEAHAAAWAVLEALNAASDSAAPVALIAQDRQLVRRCCALLARAGVPVADDTGWRLATTRAGAALLACLRAALALQQTREQGQSDPDARDVWLDWLKAEAAADAADSAAPGASGVDALERLWRQERLDAAQTQAAHACWQAAQQRLEPLLATGRPSAPLAQWTATLAHVWLNQGRSGTRWAQDAAGQAVIAALRLDPALAAQSDWQPLAQASAFTLSELARWAEHTLEGARFVPPRLTPAPPVVVLPLARAMLRPWRAVVWPGCDEQTLQAPPVDTGLLPPAQAANLGLPSREQADEAWRAAIAQAMALPNLTLIWRRHEGDAERAPSPLLAPWLRGAQAPAWQPPLQSMAATPTLAPHPSAAGALPAAVSASALEALRTCPYQFYAAHVLGLGEWPELGQAASKRDYGQWLHAVLHRFHVSAAAHPQADPAALMRAAATAEDACFDGDVRELLPFHASFAHWWPLYLQWWAQWQQDGWQWAAAEEALRAQVQGGLPPLKGRIDRIDVQPLNGGQMVMDYKTGRAEGLTPKLNAPAEDTQLLFYAAALQGEGRAGSRLQAQYLLVDEREGPKPMAHIGIAEQAPLWRQALGAEWQQMAAGAALPALGRGAACAFCRARGLCRRDHWAVPPGDGDAALEEAL